MPISLQRRAALLALVAGALAVALAARAAVQDAPPSAKPAPTTVILVRHAEKAQDDPRDPTLSEVGRERAERLARMLASAGVRHVFASEFRRTQLTVAPFARAARLEVEVVAAARQDELVAKLRALAPGEKALVAGHSNTVPKLAELLGVSLSGLEEGPAGGQIPDAQYDRLILVTLPRAAGAGPSVLELSMGD